MALAVSSRRRCIAVARHSQRFMYHAVRFAGGARMWQSARHRLHGLTSDVLHSFFRYYATNSHVLSRCALAATRVTHRLPTYTHL
eukprot:scaffold5558_cov131-Isochrysis_galbana.AAC.4